MSVTIDEIRKAADLIDGAVVRTPAAHSRTLSEITGAKTMLKFENRQFTGSFKDRGALVKLSSLAPEHAKTGVIAMSAGNHAQGVAYHAQRLGIPATIVMPRDAPFIKVQNTARFGARVLFSGESIDDAAVFAHELEEKEGLAFIPPYDDEKIIAGQGTIGLEFLADHPDLDILVVPIGGGGLISGIATAAKALKPEIEIVGVEAERYPSYERALRGLPPLSGGRTLAEGIAVKTIGKITRPIIEKLVDEILLVSEAAIEKAVLLLLEIEKTVAEGAGATPLAALLAHRDRFVDRRVGLVISGGNIDPRILSSVILLGLVRTGRLVRMLIEIADRPGVLAKVARLIAETGANIIEVHHERAFSSLPVTSAELVIACETRDTAHVEDIVRRLREAGFPTYVLSDTEAMTRADRMAAVPKVDRGVGEY